jgi:hypothetical protein
MGVVQDLLRGCFSLHVIWFVGTFEPPNEMTRHQTHSLVNYILPWFKFFFSPDNRDETVY